MKALLFFILAFLPMRGMAQISTHVSFDKKNKVLTLVVKNETDSLYRLIFFGVDPYFPLEKQSYLVFKYKNKENEVVYTRSLLINEKLPTSENRLKQYLLDYWENEYKYHLSDWYKGEVYSVDACIQIVATPIKGERETFREEIRRTYLWE